MDLSGAALAEADPSAVWESILAHAVAARVSDIHLLSQKERCDLAFRLDGDMRPQFSMPHELARKLVNHVKTLAAMDIAESRRPTEGRTRCRMLQRDIDLRVSVIPSIHGLDMVVRVLDHTVRVLDLAELGMLPEQLALAQDMISRPTGLILVSGPVGCGKTTTLYAMLRAIAGHDRKIVTIEDPVEYDLPGVNQTQVNPRIGVTFAVMLAAILRQDPDVIMVGEVRDEQTAATATRAANTGNLVLATTHATRASRAIETMLSLGAHPFFLASALRGVVTQLLVKRLCPRCCRPVPETADLAVEEPVRRRLGPDTPGRLYQGAGCDECLGTGYSGRLGLFEMFAPDARIRDLIAGRRPFAEVQQAVTETGMLTLEQAGKVAALTGRTTLEELAEMLPTI